MATYLHETGTIAITLTAAEQFARAAGVSIGDATRQLAVLLRTARKKDDTRGGAESWRARSNTSGWDLSAHVTRDERGNPLVIHVSARTLHTSRSPEAQARRNARGRNDDG